MSVLSLIKRIFVREKGSSPTSEYAFTDEDRQNSAELRKIRAKRKQILEEIELKKAIADLRLVEEELEDYDDDEEVEENGGTMEDKLFMQILSMAQQKQQPVQQKQEEQKRTMTDEEIVNIIKSFPSNQIKMAKSLPDSVLKSMIAQKMPVSEETIDRAINILRSF